MSVISALVFIFSVLSSPYLLAAESQKIHTYIVRIENDLMPLAFSEVEEWYRDTLNSVGFSANQEGGGNSSEDLLHVYKTVFHGFSARLTSEQARLLKSRPGVIGVFPDRILHVHTTRSPHFLRLASYDSPHGLLNQSDLGSNVVIGLLDTGIWPESPSFSDHGLGPVPAHFKGKCDGGRDFSASLCNKKLVGARYFQKGIQATVGPSKGFDSARDTEGHGTHTASTAAGRPRPVNASFFGYAKGSAVGMAPNARLSIYKVCWKDGCADSDILAGFDQAAQDGVDIISLSVGGAAQNYSTDPIAIGSFGAIERGIFVSASAGNSGPTPETVSNIAPWITTVGASSIDRTFPADLILGNGSVVLSGRSRYTGRPSSTETFGIVSTDDSLCDIGDLEPSKVRGKIVICSSGDISRVLKGINVKEAGGVGVVVTNAESIGESSQSDAYIYPGISLGYSSKKKLLSYLNSTRNPKAKIVFHGTQDGGGPAPAVASFSSRGPNIISPHVFKPDVIAPGVDILAAWPLLVSPTELDQDQRRSEFNIISGTSMSCPHVSGIAALIKGAHPDWSPAMIRSALMTTSYNHDHNGRSLLDQNHNAEASIWATGSGHVDPERANDPGLVYDLGIDDYIDFLCASHYSKSELKTIVKRPITCDKRSIKLWDLNYPAIVVVSEEKEQSPKIEANITRTLTKVNSGLSSYSAKVVAPRGVNVTVSPAVLSFKGEGEKKSFTVAVSGVRDTSLDDAAGSITWSDGQHSVTIPLVVMFEYIDV